MINEFKSFISKGNVIELAAGVIIGGAFSKIVNSLVNDILMPLVSLFTNGVNVSHKFIALDGVSYKTVEDAKNAGAAIFAYGNFLQATLDFLIISFVLFIIIKQVNKFRPQDTNSTTQA